MVLKTNTGKQQQATAQQAQLRKNIRHLYSNKLNQNHTLMGMFLVEPDEKLLEQVTNAALRRLLNMIYVHKSTGAVYLYCTCMSYRCTLHISMAERVSARVVPVRYGTCMLITCRG